MTPSAQKQHVIDYYDQEAARYNELYDVALLDQEFYPANAVRLEIVIERLKQRGAKTVLDVGCGSGQPLLRMLREGFDARGFDFSPRMAQFSQKTLKEAGEDPGRASVGDIEQNDSIPGGTYDAIVATGVFPHNLDDAAAYANIRARLSPNGFALIEYRNALMSLFSINRYSSAFFWSDLLRDGDGLSSDLKAAALAFCSEKFSTNQDSIGRAREIEYTEILAKFQNPLTLADALVPHKLRVIDQHFYHWHAAPPGLEKAHKDAFWKASLALERRRDWRGMFMCSAFVAEIDRD